MIKHIIFDFDGTIADTFPHVLKILRNIAKEEGIVVPPDDQLEKYKSMSFLEIAKDINFPFYKFPSVVVKTRKELKKILSKVELCKGMDEVINYLNNQNYILSIISSNTADVINDFLAERRLNNFNEVIGYGKVFGKSKPLKQYLQKHSLTEDEVIYIGDEVRDIKAAKTAGLKIIAATWGFHSKQYLISNKPDFTADTAKELLDILKNL